VRNVERIFEWIAGPQHAGQAEEKETAQAG